MKRKIRTGAILSGAAFFLAQGVTENVLSLAKIEAAACYLKAVEAVRRQCLFLTLQLFSVLLLVVALVAAPPILLHFLPWEASVKLTCMTAWVFLLIAAPLFYLARVYSERRWMDFSKSREILEKVLAKNI